MSITTHAISTAPSESDAGIVYFEVYKAVVFVQGRRANSTSFAPWFILSERKAAATVANKYILANPAFFSVCSVLADHAGDGSSTSCNECGSLRAAGPGSESKPQAAGQGSPQGSASATATAASPQSAGGATILAHPPPPPDTGDGCGGGAKMRLGPAAEEQALVFDSEICEEGLARAAAAFEDGMKAYMREDPEVSREKPWFYSLPAL